MATCDMIPSTLDIEPVKTLLPKKPAKKSGIFGVADKSSSYADDADGASTVPSPAGNHSDVTRPEDIQTIYSYMRTFASELGERILEKYPPLHAHGDPVSPLLHKLLRAPLPAQKIAIMGLVKWFKKKKKSANIIGECGTGKSFMAAATCYVHAEERPFTSIVMVPPHLVLKWAREIYLTVPNARCFIIDGMRNRTEHNMHHSVNEVVYDKNTGDVKRKGRHYRLYDLRSSGNKKWKKDHPYPSFFIVSREKGKLSYFWKPAFNVKASGPDNGFVLNPDTGKAAFVVNEKDQSQQMSPKELLALKSKVFEIASREHDGTSTYSPLWQADNTRIHRFAPMDYIGKYMKGWFDYGIADEAHQLAGDTAQGNALSSLYRASRYSMAMTGTWLGGYADDIYNILFRMDGPKMVRDGFSWGGKGRTDYMHKYGVLVKTTKMPSNDNVCSRNSRKHVSIRRLPGASPLLFSNYMMENSVFVSLEDISEVLPPFLEEVISVKAPQELMDAYTDMEKDFKGAILQYGPQAVASSMLHTLLLYPDHPYDIGDVYGNVVDQKFQCRVKTLFTSAPDLDKNIVYPKEAKLVEDIKIELAKGRRCHVFATYTGQHDVNSRLHTVLTNAGIRTSVLHTSIPTEIREEWYRKEIKSGTQVVICHPRLVETGLDLLWFPTLYFYETGYSLHTLRQASRRSWRIGQKEPVVVKYMCYQNTMQEKCVHLMGKKMLVSLMIEGKFSGEGLSTIEEDTDLVSSMARELVMEAKVGDNADNVWRSIKSERDKMMNIGNGPVPTTCFPPALPSCSSSQAPSEDLAMGQHCTGPVPGPLSTAIPEQDQPPTKSQPSLQEIITQQILTFAYPVTCKRHKRARVNNPAQLVLFAP